MACKLCKNLVKETCQQSRFWIEFTPKELYLSVHNRNCPSCAIILEGIILMQVEGWSFKHDVSKAYGYGLASQKDTLALELYFRDGRPRITYEYFIAEDSNHLPLSPWAAIQPRTSIKGDPTSQASLQWAKSMIQHCLQAHFCHKHESYELPTRLLVCERTCDGEILVKLIEAPIGTSNRVSRYATLSHCWGTQVSCTTTLENINKRKCGIPWTELPVTFQDAIRYCLELEIQYLWIDALCIIQDSPIDWQTQSSQMAHIYQNSFITLAATQSNSGCVGFLERSGPTCSEFFWDVNTETGTYRLGIRPRLSHWDKTDPSHREHDYPLLTRAWAFQERILSPRVLHFCKQELVWECVEEMRCECGDLTKPSSLKTRFCFDERPWLRERRYYKRAVLRPLETPHRYTNRLIDYWSNAIQAHFGIRVFLTAWNQAVSEFSSLELTKEEDRLPALSGLAVQMQSIMGQYNAGLWESEIVCGLTWRVDVLKPGARRPQRYRAPTWSWASVDSKVKYRTQEEIMPPSEDAQRLFATRARHYQGDERHDNYVGDQVFQQHQHRTNRIDNPQPCAKALEVRVKTEERNPFGRVLGGILFVEGILQQGELWDDRGSLPSSSLKIDPDSPRSQIKIFGPKDATVPSLVVPFYADYTLNHEPHNPASTRTVYVLTLCPGIGLYYVTQSDYVIRPTRAVAFHILYLAIFFSFLKLFPIVS